MSGPGGGDPAEGDPATAGAIPADGGPLVFVDDLDAPRLATDDHHHLARVRRVRDGDPLILGDGRGAWRRARMAGDAPEPDGEVVAARRPSPPLAVGFALSKGDKPEWCVQKLTELGIDRIVAFTAARSVVRWDDRKAAAAHERRVKGARAAAAQSRAAHLPVVEPVTDFAAVAARPGACRADRGGAPPTLAHPLVLVGPEGGWDETERAAELPAVGLAGGVLRAELAAIAAGAVLAALRHGLVAPAG